MDETKTKLIILTPPPPTLRKHQESQKNDGQTGSRCLAINSGKFSDRPPPTDLCLLIQFIVID